MCTKEASSLCSLHLSPNCCSLAMGFSTVSWSSSLLQVSTPQDQELTGRRVCRVRLPEMLAVIFLITRVLQMPGDALEGWK